MPTFWVYRIRTACPECGSALMLDGPWNKLKCRACASVVEIGEKRWQSLLDFRSLGAPEAETRAVHMSDKEFSFFVRFGQKWPECANCQSPLDLAGVGPGTDGAVACRGCGQQTSTFPPPDWLKNVEPGALQIFGAEREGDTAAAGATADAAARVVSFACPDCGANLKISGESPRILTCSYCHSDLYLPDALWHTLHPVRKRRPWYVAFA